MAATTPKDDDVFGTFAMDEHAAVNDKGEIDIAIVGQRLRAVHRITMDTWECPLADVTCDHLTPDEVARQIATAIAGRDWICDCDNTRMAVWFMVHTPAGHDLIDLDQHTIAATLRIVARPESEMVMLRLRSQVMQQHAEIARLAHQVATSCELARRVHITELIAQAAVQFGPIDPLYFALAQRVFAAEVDGAPIVFRALGCDQPIWLRSVIRYVNASEPFTHCVTEGMSAHDIAERAPMQGLVLAKPIGANTMSSPESMDLGEWIIRRGPACRAQVLVVMELAYTWMGARRGIARIPAYTSTFGLVRRHIAPTTTCPCPTVIFGYYGGDAGATTTTGHDEYRDEAARRRDILHTWLSRCTSVRLAKFCWDREDDARDGRLTETMPIENISPEIARAFADAIPATSANGIPDDSTYIHNRGAILPCTWDIPPFISRLSEECAPL